MNSIIDTILDNPITLNAENNYTANLTMSVSFE